MKTDQTNCEIRKNVLFIMKSSAFDGDRNFQAARMALSLALDAVPHILFSGKALALATNNKPIEKPLSDFYGQERFLQELGIPCYVVREELDSLGPIEEEVRPGILTISSRERDVLLKRMDFVITA